MKNLVKISWILSLLLITGCAKKEESRVSEDLSGFIAKDEITGLWSDYVYVFDGDTNQVLMDQGSEEVMYPASITKIMTAIIAIEEIDDLNTTIPFTQEMYDDLRYTGLTRAGFMVGDEPTALDYLYACLLPSGADGSLGLAVYVAGDEESFVELMNEKAAELGMTNTHFVNTSGYHNDNHYSTCRDLGILYEYCMQNETFMEILSSAIYTSTPLEHFPDGLGMTNFVLCYINRYSPEFDYNYEIPGFIAGKSGYTDSALYTLACNAEINGMNLILVDGHGYNVAHHPVEIEDASTIFNWYNEHYARRTAVEEGEVFGSVKVEGTFFQSVNAVAAESVTLDLPSDENMHIVFTIDETVEAPITEGTTIGSCTIYDYDTAVKTIDLVADRSVEKNVIYQWID